MFCRNAGYSSHLSITFCEKFAFWPTLLAEHPPEYIRQFHVEQPGYIAVKSVFLSGR